MKRAVILVFVCLAANAHAARFLFDADHAESGNNADWVIDADAHNISWLNSGTFTTSSGNESNAQRIPTPPASGISAGTPETYWAGAISAWAVDLVKRGHSVETLPAGTTLTWNTANSQDLTNYDVVVIDEPDILFATSEKQALLNFVAHGGGLFMISDHVGSIRTTGTGTGTDAVHVWNDFLTNNGVTNNPFGIVFRLTGTGIDSSGNNTFNRSIPGNPILNGLVGVATNMAYFNGNEFQIDNTKNPTAISQMWFGAQSDSNNFCGLASLQYGSGRVVVCGDSSCIDDGTGDPNDTSLFDGYTTDAGGVQHIWILNSSEWLATPAALPLGLTNSWTSTASGKWEMGANWFKGTPSLTDAGDLITNASTKTITIDATTALSNAVNGCMTISNLILSAPSGATNTLSVSSAGLTPMHVLRSLAESVGGALFITNSMMVLDDLPVGQTNIFDGLVTVSVGGQLIATNSLNVLGSTNGANGQLNVTGGNVLISQTMTSLNLNAFILGLVTNSTGRVTISGGTLTVTNSDMYVGNFGSGQITVSNGALADRVLYLGSRDGGNGALTVTGSSSTNINVGLAIGFHAGATGSVWITDGALLTNTTGLLEVGVFGVGTLDVTNATVAAGGMDVGVAQSGTATFVGSTVTLNNITIIGGNNGPIGTAIARNSQFIITNTLYVGASGDGRFSLSNSTLRAADVYVGVYTSGTLTLQDADTTVSGSAYVGLFGGGTGVVWLAGGTATMSPSVVVGDCASNGVGQLIISNGIFAVTNAAHNAVLDVRDGLVSVTGPGILLADVIVSTNVCGHVQHSAGGSIVATSVLLDPNFSAAGDGILNGWKQQYGLDPFDPGLGSQDPDHDGFTNLQEFQAGTDPTNLISSSFRITDIHSTGSDVSVSWLSGTGVTNALQATAGDGNGGYNTNGFADIFTVTNTSGNLTNYLDTGTVTNFPSRYYRVRLVP